jgi:betaine reductase
VLVKEFERAGIPAAHVCALTPVAAMVGSHRIIPVGSIVHPMGDPNLDPNQEKAFRRDIVEKALKALQHSNIEQ